MFIATCRWSHGETVLAARASTGTHCGMADGAANRETESQRLDLWLALAAGPAPWLDGEALDAEERLALSGGIISAVAAALVVTAAASASPRLTGIVPTLALGLGILALVSLVVSAPFCKRHSGVGGPAGRLAPIVTIRLVASLGVLAIVVRVFGTVPALIVAGFGLTGGIEAAVTLRVLGADIPPRQLLRRSATSTLHLGVVTGLVGIALLGRSGDGPAIALQVATAFYALAASAMISFIATRSLLADHHRQDADRVDAARIDAHRDNAHWLHDDVCSELRYLRLHVETDGLDRPELLARLDQLDHRLRLRQLDEVLYMGTATLSEIIQPYIRAAQNNGVALLEVPSYETAGMVISAAAGRQVQRAVAVLVANAIQAGASSLRLRTIVDDGRVVVEVEDDAGGFRPDATVAGRGLDSLRRDLGASGLVLEPTPQGTVARSTISLDLDLENARP